MCGINGFNFSNKSLIKEMNKAIKHRGPDGEGEYVNSDVSLGHVRLAIIDLSKKGKQPMKYTHKGKEVVIVFNGEIYNFLEIKKELLKKGYNFRSKTDTEIIAASYLEWGDECVKKFNGMWAFCIYDLDKNIFFLSRDRLGVKPLYYYFNGKDFVFSSELKGILACKNLKINTHENISKKSVELFFSFGFIPSPYSIFKNIFKLEPAMNLVFDLERKKIYKKKFWEIPSFSPIKNYQLLRKEFFKLFEDSIKKRLISDVEVGILLSGGLDSSTIFSFLCKKIRKRSCKSLKTFSIGFEEKEIDETELIKLITSNFSAKNFYWKLKENHFDKEKNAILSLLDEPFADFSIFPTHFLCKNASNYVKVTLSGDGGDEVFGGYEHYIKIKNLLLLSTLPKPILKFLEKNLKGKFKRACRIARDFKEKKYVSYFVSDKSKFFSESAKKIIKEKILYSLKKSNGNVIEAFRIFDLSFFTLSDNFLTKVDRASMFNSLEVRSPFLDYRLIEFSQKIPTNLKVSRSHGKIFLRSFAEKLLPKKILKSKKRGFIPPFWKYFKKEEKGLKESLEKLYQLGIIPEKIFNFYNKKIFGKNVPVKPIYLGRLFMFYEWYKRWVTN